MHRLAVAISLLIAAPAAAQQQPPPVDVRVVLGGDDNGLDALRLAAVVLDGDLRLAVGAQEG